MQTAHWYLIQYDIRCKRRGQKVYKLMKRCAFSLQESVFAWQGTNSELKVLQEEIKARINRKEDDIRGYKINQPLSFFGTSPFVSDIYFSGYPPHQALSIDCLLKTEGYHAMDYLL